MNETNLTNSPERPYDMDPVWSPDGSKIAFTSQYLVDELTKHPIHIMNSDGTNETPRLDLVKPSSFELAWSPDGLQFAFEHDGIAIINVDGSGELIKLTSSHIGGLPSWK